MSKEQLENIDCLMCHAKGYNRDLYDDGKGGYEWKPILWKNKEGLNSVSKRITSPTRAMCLRCHSASGGGANFKRGDLEYTLADPERNFDVHMATEGKNMQCVACHKGEDHRIPGRGTDLSGSDMPSKRLTCDTSSCHSSPPHKNKVLNNHAENVNCTVCHIPKFARDEATDMFRDWSVAVYNKEKDKYFCEHHVRERCFAPICMVQWLHDGAIAKRAGEPAFGRFCRNNDAKRLKR